MRKIKKVITSIEEYVNKKDEISYIERVSTGSTLLDLAVSGGISKYGGLPGGIIAEFFGPPGNGKTAILAEISGYTKAMGGDVLFLDSEKRFSLEYAEQCGIDIDPDNFRRPTYVSEFFNCIKSWEPKSDGPINTILIDSLTALITEAQEEGKDKYGTARAKQISEGLREISSIISDRSWLIVCSNQIRMDIATGRETTPGGKSIPFYSSVRVRVGPSKGRNVTKSITKGGKVLAKKVTAIRSNCLVKKNTVDDPFRECDYLYITFGYGIDDIRGNLQYLKDINGWSKYKANGESFKQIKEAINFIEENGSQNKLRDQVVDKWKEIENSMKEDRKPKLR